MFAYGAVHLFLDIVAVAVAMGGGAYAIRSLLLLNRNQELLRIQRRIWLPVLCAGGFLALDSVVRLAAYLAASTISSDVLDSLHALLLIASLAVLSLGIFRYWSTQNEYESEKSGGQPTQSAAAGST